MIAKTREFITKNGITQSMLARSIGVSAAQISQYLKDGYKGDVAGLETKLNESIQNQDLLSQKITDSEETLKLEFHGVATQSKDEIKDHQTDLNNELKSELEANKQLISDLQNQISNYEAGNIEARNNILGGLVGLENQLNGLNSKLDGLASGGGTGGTGGNDDVLAGLGNIDNTLKDVAHNRGFF